MLEPLGPLLEFPRSVVCCGTCLQTGCWLQRRCDITAWFTPCNDAVFRQRAPVIKPAHTCYPVREGRRRVVSVDLAWEPLKWPQKRLLLFILPFRRTKWFKRHYCECFGVLTGPTGNLSITAGWEMAVKSAGTPVTPLSFPPYPPSLSQWSHSITSWCWCVAFMFIALFFFSVVF